MGQIKISNPNLFIFCFEAEAAQRLSRWFQDMSSITKGPTFAHCRSIARFLNSKVILIEYSKWKLFKDKSKVVSCRRKIHLKTSEVRYTLKQGAFASLQDFWRIQNMRSKEHAKTLDALTISNRKHRSSRFAWHWFEKIQTANFWVYLNSVNGHIKGHCKNWLSSLYFVNNLITDLSWVPRCSYILWIILSYLRVSA